MSADDHPGLTCAEAQELIDDYREKRIDLLNEIAYLATWGPKPDHPLYDKESQPD